MIKVEIEGFHDLIRFINLFIGEDQIKQMTDDLNNASDELINAEKQDGETNASTGSN